MLLLMWAVWAVVVAVRVVWKGGEGFVQAGQVGAVVVSGQRGAGWRLGSISEYWLEMQFFYVDSGYDYISLP